jgi:hypothetical protein
MTIRRRRTKNAESRVTSLFDESDHTPATVLTISRTTFLKERMYGSRFNSESSVMRRVEASDRFSRRCCIDTVCDLRRGVIVRNFFESVGIRILPPALSLAGRWWFRTLGTSVRAETRTW